MKKEEIDVIICYGSECESGTIRYFTGFWPFFDFVSSIIPQEGEAILITGGPESHDFAEEFSKVSNIKINSLPVETSAPNWIRKIEELNFLDIWLSDGKYGLRYEDGALVTEKGLEELTSYRKEVIIL